MKHPLFLLAGLLTGAWAQAQMSPVGLWQSIDDGNGLPKAEIAIVQTSDGALSGRVERSLLPEPGAEPLCVLCSDDRRNQPKIGLEIIRGARQTEGKAVWEGGAFWTPKTARSTGCD